MVAIEYVGTTDSDDITLANNAKLELARTILGTTVEMEYLVIVSDEEGFEGPRTMVVKYCTYHVR